MAEYKISQKPEKPARPSIKSFWIPKLQAKKLNRKTATITLAVAGVAIVVGAVFAAIKLTSQKPTTPRSTLPLISSTTKPGSAANQTAHAVPAAAYQALKTAVATKNASLLNAFFAAKVRIVIIDSNINEVVDAAEAAALINDGLGAAQNPWNFNVTRDQLIGWQNGPYGQYFSGTVAVGISANGDVISVGFDNNGQINSVFVAPSNVLDNTSSSSSSGSAAGTMPPAPTSATAQD